ncbi:MAG: MBL fold metallo-hydrolase [Bacteroidota bacterium]|jgi:hydroxyacylglutathione hydrolase
MKIKKFTFGPFQENTFLVYDFNGECAIIDPGCFGASDQKELSDFITSENLKPTHLLNTHTHLDHISGNLFVYEKYGLKPQIHEADLPILNMQEQSSLMYGLPCEKSPKPDFFIKEGDKINIGKISLNVIFAPGHSPGHVVFFDAISQQLIGGDVLFYNSIGRTDLPMGNHAQLIDSIKSKIFPLGENVKVYCGHGPETMIGFEKRTNPFLID